MTKLVLIPAYICLNFIGVLQHQIFWITVVNFLQMTRNWAQNLSNVRSLSRVLDVHHKSSVSDISKHVVCRPLIANNNTDRISMPISLTKTSQSSLYRFPDLWKSSPAEFNFQAKCAVICDSQRKKWLSLTSTRCDISFWISIIKNLCRLSHHSPRINFRKVTISLQFQSSTPPLYTLQHIFQLPLSIRHLGKTSDHGHSRFSFLFIPKIISALFGVPNRNLRNNMLWCKYTYLQKS